MKGILITFEGIDYSGKTTQVEKLVSYLRRKSYKVILLREPGGEKVSESIRQVLLASKNTGMNPVTELLLYIASRAQLVSKIILPALKNGKIVICDRFYDSTLAYQGYGRGLDKKTIEYLNKISTLGVKPELTILIDIPIGIFVKRMRKNDKKKDRIEKEKINFYKNVRDGYLKIAQKEKNRFRVIDGSDEIVKVWERVKTAIDNFLKLDKNV
ncbi:MAG: dTMP kinase [candidate division Zixibacteria bacterium]|nr:dTMP kinase [candidate division Zixibacteria bacterium]